MCVPVDERHQPLNGEFDAQGRGYDMKTARLAGLKPADNGHWGSRDPNTGMLLKGTMHKTWPLLEQGEREAGMEIYPGTDGRMYSRPAGG